MDDKAAHKRGLISRVAGNSVAANLIMVALIVGGLVVTTMITQEVFPEFDLDTISITVSYPGASPEEIEKGVVISIEEEIRSLEQVERVISTSTEGRASIRVELLGSADPNKTLQEVKSAVDRISSLPDDAERPDISLLTRRRGVVRLALYGDVPEHTLFGLAKTIREELTSLPEITQVELRGTRAPEVSIEVPQSMLRAHGLTLGEIARSIRERAVDVPAGGIKTKGGEVLLRTTERRDYARDFNDISFISRADGTEVALSDIARIREGFAETDRESYYNGQRAVLIYVYRTGEQTPLEISRATHEYMDSLRTSLPENIGIKAYRDRSVLYKDRLRLLLGNGSLGLVLVLLALGLFLEPRLAFWVSMGIPISITGSLVILYAIGGSINMVSMFAFIITLGIVVDDAVVVGENIFYKRQDAALSPLAASIAGVREMTLPVTVAVATNVMAFMPLMFVSGSMGRFFSILPTVVVSVFLISLLECLFILPAHLAYPRNAETSRVLGILGSVPKYCGAKLKWFIDDVFTPALRFSLSSRYFIAAVSVAVLIVSFAYIDSGRLNFSFRPSIQTDSIDAEIELPYGAPVEEVRRVARLLEEGGLRAIDANGGREILVGVMTDIGRGGSNKAEISFTLVPQGQREITTRQFSIKWREEVGEVAGLENLFFDYLVGPGGSSAIKVELTHPEPRVLEAAATELAGIIGKFKGVTDINDGFAQGKPQLDFTMRPEGHSLGLNAKELGTQVRHAFYGAEALRQQRGRDELKVMVRLPEAERKSLYNLEQLLIMTPEGGEVPLASAANIKYSHAYTSINRVDGKRVINVTANVVPGEANENKILASLRADHMAGLMAKHPGLRYSFQGRQREQRKAAKSLLLGIGLVLPGIFGILAITFRSYALSLFVMLSIPFGIISAIIGHLIMGYDLSIISIFGMIALCGIVINGGLVFTVTANRYCSEGSDPHDAAFKAARRRFRPIVLTAFTTFLGLAPMIFEQSVQARFLVPMAISLGYGILFTTVVILVLMPSLFVICHDMRRLVSK